MSHSPPHKKQKLADEPSYPGGAARASVPTKVDPFKVLTSRPPTVFNNKFVTFYKAQGIFTSDQDFTDFIETLQIDLPTTFRITSTGRWTKLIHYIFTELFVKNKEAARIEIDSTTTVDVEPPRTLPWYPNELGWHYEPSKKSLRSDTMLKHVKHFLNIESEIGNLSRQEAVSMIPALLLDVKSHHRVLDMCAAPGSKTCQLIELLHANNVLHPTGIVIANDVDLARCYMLGHITARLGSQALLITNYEAQKFPFIRLPNADNAEESHILTFDRVLCDVPCSGDGTIRKGPEIGKLWSPKNAEHLHPLQLQIGWRGAQLLDVGGTMVYSTCALNPIEDEAVVAHLLRVSGGALELVDVSDQLPALQRRSGLSTWQMMDEGNMVHATKVDQLADPQRRFSVTMSMLPPSEEEAQRFNLHRCMRLLPHLQNTGGFFIAVLRKVAPIDMTKKISPAHAIPVAPDAPAPTPVAEAADESVKEFLESVTTTTEAQQAQRAKGGRRATFKEEPFFVLPPSAKEELLNRVSDFFGLDRSSGYFEYLVTRRGDIESEEGDLADKINRTYLLNKLAHSIIANGKPEGISPDPANPALLIRVISAGLRLFENDAKRNKRVELKCPWRLQPESLSLVVPHLSKRMIPITRDDLLKYLDTQQPIPYEAFSADAQAAFAKYEDLGCCLMVLDPSKGPKYEGDGPREQMLFGEPFYFLGWRGRGNAALWIDKLEIKSYRNIFLSKNYDIDFDPTPRRPDPEKREAGIARSAANRAEKHERKLAKRAAAAAVAEAAKAAGTTSSDSTPAQTAQ